MSPRSLQLTFVEGRPVGAYLYLPAEARPPVSRTEERGRDLIVDFAADGSPIGVEIVSFRSDVPVRLNRLLAELGVPPLTPEEIRPLDVA